MSTGKFIKSGGKLMTTYNETGDEMYNLIDDYYGATFSMFKSAGAPMYNNFRAAGGYPSTGYGYFNALMGKDMTAAMFSCDNAFTSIGARPYQHEGVRIIPEFATYGREMDFNVANTNTFLGIGATTVQDGRVPNSVRMPVDEVRQPYKELPMAFDYGLGLMALEHKEDDTIQYKAYIEKMAVNYSDLVDKTLLRPLKCPQPNYDLLVSAISPYTGSKAETSLNGIARCICSGSEITTATEPTTFAEQSDISPGMVSPYGGVNGDFYSKRGSGGTSHVLNNYDGNVVNLNNSVLSIADMRKLYRTTAVNWADSANPNNKIFLMSNLMQDKLGALMLANNVLLDTQYVEKTFNGVKTIPGRDIGLLVNTFQNIPIIQDGNLNFDFEKKRVSSTKSGDIFLLDLDHIWMSMLTPIEMYNVNNPALTGYFQEKNLMSMRAETRIDSFIQHGRITGIANES